MSGRRKYDKFHQYYTEKEKDIIRKYYGKEGYEIQNRLPGRSIESIRNMASRMGLFSTKIYKAARWTTMEEQILKENIDRGIDFVQELIPWRSYASIDKKARRLQLMERKFWNSEEEKLLEINAQKCSTGELAKLLNRSINSIQNKRVRMGIDCVSDTYWTEEECRIIEKYYPTEYLDVAVRLNRTFTAVCKQISKMIDTAKIQWKPKEIGKFIKLYEEIGIGALHEMEGKSYFECLALSKELELDLHRWTLHEDRLIFSGKSMGYFPNNSLSQVKWRSEHLGENAIRRRLTKEDKDIIATRYPIDGFRLLYDLPDIRYYQICSYAEKCRLQHVFIAKEDVEEAIHLVTSRINYQFRR